MAAPPPLSFKSAYEHYIESVLAQTPLTRIPAPLRPLVHIVRTRLCHRFGGALPNFSPVNGKDLSRNALHEIARAGIARLSHSYTAADLRDDCEIQLGLTFAPVIPPDDLKELPYTFKSAYERFIAHFNGWTALDDIAEYDRSLIAGARAHILNVLGGWMPRRMPIPPHVCFGGALVGDWIAHGGTGLDLKMRLHMYRFLMRNLFSLGRNALGDYVRITPAPTQIALANAWFAHYPALAASAAPTILRPTLR